MSQISLETVSKHSPEEVIRKAKQKFIDDFGLETIEESDCCLRLEGGGEFVFIQAELEGKKTKVLLQGREWSHQMKQFMKEI